ncbi:GGDEF domain-containing protein [Azoarcus sp. L1K30]|uniref:diguanylate cyclase n=1 Tax=Azoarcus sp. L1K30 TaxID=2820277 RepID=UPI001B83E81A|nr:diguanylate cyclase [Azoarcus sp. L1K30]MBR0567098.1 GGDEF domain-containing protein [Azoarcus sp. L1K30]
MSSRCTLLLRICMLGVALAFAVVANARAIPLDEVPEGSLGLSAGVYVERDKVLTIEDALSRLERGEFEPAGVAVPKFGIGAGPVWLHLSVENRGMESVARRLLAGVSWIDRLDVYMVERGRVVSDWLAGDGDARWQHPLGNLGYAFDHTFAPGTTDILLRAQTADPMVLPLRLLSAEDATAWMRLQDYGYGMLYGFLLALIAYNAVLFASLRDPNYLNYALYLGAFIVVNLGYTGRGYEWLWPQYAGLQQYVILVLMVVFGYTGLRFARRFLELERVSPRADRAVRLFANAGLCAIALSAVFEQRALAALVAFVFVLLFSVAMVGLGLLCSRRGKGDAHYFLAGAVVAMFGAATTALAVWVGLPYSETLFHVAELGIVIEGSLLALALAYRMRLIQTARMQAEHLSRTDPLTGLLNRRAFLDSAGAAWSTAVRSGRPLSVIVIDLDHFKTINDTFGHETGDRVLVAVAEVLRKSCRRGDFSARWGGEEFILILPETDAGQAMAMAERLLADIRAATVPEKVSGLRLSASLGVAERHRHDALEALIREADGFMYRAKQRGRGRVHGAQSDADARPVLAPD